MPTAYGHVGFPLFSLRHALLWRELPMLGATLGKLEPKNKNRGVLCRCSMFSTCLFWVPKDGYLQRGFHWTHWSLHFKRPSPEFTSMEDDCTKRPARSVWEFPLTKILPGYRIKITDLIDYHVLMYLSCVCKCSSHSQSSWFIVVFNVLQPFANVYHTMSWFGVHRASSFLVLCWQHVPTINENKCMQPLVAKVNKTYQSKIVNAIRMGIWNMF